MKFVHLIGLTIYSTLTIIFCWLNLVLKIKVLVLLFSFIFLGVPRQGKSKTILLS